MKHDTLKKLLNGGLQRVGKWRKVPLPPCAAAQIGHGQSLIGLTMESAPHLDFRNLSTALDAPREERGCEKQANSCNSRTTGSFQVGFEAVPS